MLLAWEERKHRSSANIPYRQRPGRKLAKYPFMEIKAFLNPTLETTCIKISAVQDHTVLHYHICMIVIPVLEKKKNKTH